MSDATHYQITGSRERAMSSAFLRRLYEKELAKLEAFAQGVH